MQFPAPLARLGLVVVLISSCGTPPEYAFLQTAGEVTLNGRVCQADIYSVMYDRLFTLGQPESVITRDRGTQYRIECGATTTSCRLDQSLEDCIAALERPASSDSSGYSPPSTY